MRVATWNIYWLGHDPRGLRTPEQESVLADALVYLDADLLCLQEIVDRATLDRIVALASTRGARTWSCRHGGRFLGGGGQSQKIAFVYDVDEIEVLGGRAVRGGEKRWPYAVRLRTGEREITAVGLHLQSGWPSFDDPADAAKRHRQCEALVRWLAGEAEADNPELPRPQTDEVLLLGDYNHLHDSASLAPLREGPMAGWSWLKPAAPEGLPAISSIDDRVLIDFIQLSPAAEARRVAGPRIVAIDRALGVAEADVKGLSDHRPVVVELD